MEDTRELIEKLTRSREDLLQRAAGLPDDALRRRPRDEQWSVLEVLAHLPAVDEHWLAQAMAIRADPTYVFVPFDDERWKQEHAGVRELPAALVLTQVEDAHASVLRALAALPAGDLGRAGRHPRGVPYTVRDVFLRYIPHDQSHAEQIDAIRAGLGL
jgi:uncharacterized damage-inducible protein DinB